MYWTTKITGFTFDVMFARKLNFFFTPDMLAMNYNIIRLKVEFVSRNFRTRNGVLVVGCLEHTCRSYNSRAYNCIQQQMSPFCR